MILLGAMLMLPFAGVAVLIIVVRCRQWRRHRRWEAQHNYPVNIPTRPEEDDGEFTGWLCDCGAWVEHELHCDCGAEPPWGCDCGCRDANEGWDDVDPMTAINDVEGMP